MVWCNNCRLETCETLTKSCHYTKTKNKTEAGFFIRLPFPFSRATCNPKHANQRAIKGD